MRALLRGRDEAERRVRVVLLQVNESFLHYLMAV
jgi:hypothetical protein